MLLTSSRIPIIITGLIAFFAIVLLFTVGQVNAGDSTGEVTDAADFEDGLGMAAGSDWNWTGQGNQMKVVVFLAPALNNITEIEVYVEPTTTDIKQVFSQRPTAGGAFPTGVNIAFIGTVPATRQIGAGAPFVVGGVLPLVPGTTIVGIHLVDSTDTDIVRSAAPPSNGLVDLTTPATAPPPADEDKVFAEPLVTPPPEASPPPTGDLAPGPGLVLPILLVGFLLILAGGVYLARDRRLRS